MFESLLPSLVSAGSSLLGGLLGRSSGEKQQEAQIANQRDFAQHGIQWKVADAKAAGVHPLYALGGSTQSYSPTVVGDPLPGAIEAAGQNISRGIAANSNKEQRVLQVQGAQLDLETKRLNNEILKMDLASKAARLTQGVGPPAPAAGKSYVLDGQGDTQTVPLPIANPRSVVMSQQWPTSKQNVQLGPIWKANPYVSNAKDVEDRYGEGISDYIWPLITVPADVAYNTYRNRSSIKRGLKYLWNETFGTRPAY